MADQRADPAAADGGAAARRVAGPDAAAGAQTTAAPGDQGRADAGAGAEVDAEVNARVAELQARVAETENQWRRALADLDNLRKRVARDAEQLRTSERARAAAEWLPVIDNLDLALRHAESEPGAIVEGLRAVRDQALAVLARLGFPRRDDVGASFDPARHEAVAAVTDAEAPAGTVVEVVRPGYGDDERQLRPAAVVVATRPG